MAIRGWVYVVSNQAMPGLLKVGFSTKDPTLRALELNNTGAPHPYVVLYDALVQEPRDVEQRVHRDLQSRCVGKEWFSCPPDVAVAAIRRVAAGKIITETPYAFPEPARQPSAPWTLDVATGVLTHHSSGTKFTPSQYNEESGGYVIKTWLIKGWNIPWVRWNEVEIIE